MVDKGLASSHDFSFNVLSCSQIIQRVIKILDPATYLSLPKSYIAGPRQVSEATPPLGQSNHREKSQRKAEKSGTILFPLYRDISGYTHLSIIPWSFYLTFNLSMLSCQLATDATKLLSKKNWGCSKKDLFFHKNYIYSSL